MVWRLIARFSSLLAKRYRQPWNEYLKVYRSDVQSIRWERCVAEVKSHFGMAIGRMFVDEVFRNGSKLEVNKEHIIQSIWQQTRGNQVCCRFFELSEYLFFVL